MGSTHDLDSVVEAAHHQGTHHAKTQPLPDTLPCYTNQHDEYQESAGCYPAQRGSLVNAVDPMGRALGMRSRLAQRTGRLHGILHRFRVESGRSW
jgi:hypothetical protein